MIKTYLYFPAFAIDVDLFQEGLAKDLSSILALVLCIQISRFEINKDNITS